MPLLMTRPERHFTFPHVDVPPIAETLLVPFAAGGAIVGVVWLGSHDDSRPFDREDLRVLLSLSECASLAHQALARNAKMQVALVKERADFALLRAISAALIHETRERHRFLIRADPGCGDVDHALRPGEPADAG